MATVLMAPVLSSLSTKRGSREFRSYTTIGLCHVTKATRTEKTMEDCTMCRQKEMSHKSASLNLGFHAGRLESASCLGTGRHAACRPIGLHRGRVGESGV